MASAAAAGREGTLSVMSCLDECVTSDEVDPSDIGQPETREHLASDRGDRRTLLIRQLEIAWRFAEAFVLDDVDEALALWAPSGNVCTVHPTTSGWVADWPDEEQPPIPDVMIGWILWHIEWWWTNAAAGTLGRPATPPQEHRWSGGTQGLTAAKAAWDQILGEADLDQPVGGVMPEPQPLWFVAAWVNFELTKNLAEINHLRLLHGNRQTAASDTTETAGS